MFMCAHVYDVVLCGNTVKKCGSWPDWLATPDLRFLTANRLSLRIIVAHVVLLKINVVFIHALCMCNSCHIREVVQ